jgi:hypothetical protein
MPHGAHRDCRRERYPPRAGSAADVEYVPVEREGEAERLVPCWTFSSGINYTTNRNLVFWVAARTGEVV